MKKTAKKGKKIAVAPEDEMWEVVQVASHMGRSYQTARNQMLQGIFGPSEYDATSRKLTVHAERVRKVKSREEKKRRKAG